MSKLLEINDIEKIVNGSFTNKEMVTKLNNLLIDRELQIIDSHTSMLDHNCGSYTRMVVKLTEMRGEAVARKNQKSMDGFKTSAS